MSGYKIRFVDLEDIFEPLSAGDARYPLDTGYADNGVDAKDKYVPISQGAMYHENVQYSRVAQDLRNIFAAKGSVPRFNAIPWARTVAPAIAPTIYRQPSRALITRVAISCSIKEDGRCEILASSPNLHSHPTNLVNDTIYALTSPAAWNNAAVPAGVDFEIKFELISGSGVSSDAPVGFNTWVRMTPGHAGATLRAVLDYNHATTAEGLKTAVSSIRISVRRTDYPATNKTEDILTANLSINVLESLFSPKSNWEKTFNVVNDGANRYRPEGLSLNFTNDVKVSFNQDGTLVFSTKEGAGSWLTSLTTRWRRADAEVPSNDYDVICEVTGNGGLTISNPIAAWTQVAASYEVSARHTVGDNNPPNTYNKSATMRLSVRQRSTRGYVQSGITLPDNQVVGAFTFASDIVVLEPAGYTWPNVSPWDGSWTTQATGNLNPIAPYNLSSVLKMAFNVNGTVTVSDLNGVKATGTWVPAGKVASDVEIMAVLSPSGSAAANEVNQLATWTTITSGEKYVQTTATRLHSSGVGASNRIYSGKIILRRKNYPSDLIEVPITLTATSTFEAPLGYEWPSSSWAGSRSATKTALMNPEAPNSVSESVNLVFNANGTVNVTSGSGDLLSSGRWYPNGAPASDVELMVSVNGSGVPGSDVNQLPTWTSFTTGTKTVSVQVSRVYAAGIGTSSRSLEGTISVRRKSWTSDGYTVGIALNANAQLNAPNAPNWTGMSLPALSKAVQVDKNYAQGNRWETAKVKYVMMPSSDPNANNVQGREIYDTQLGTNADGVDSDIVRVNTRIVPVGWAPSEFEWRWRRLSGTIADDRENIWRNMSTEGFDVQNAVTVNHGVGPTLVSQSATIAVDVRRIAYPTHTHTFTTTLTASVEIVQSGPDWDSITLPNHTTTLQAGSGQNYSGETDVVSTGYRIAVNEGASSAKLVLHSWKGSDMVPTTLDDAISNQLVPIGWPLSDLEWKWESAGVTGDGAFVTGYYSPGAVAAQNTWYPLTDIRYIPFYTDYGVSKPVGTTLTSTGKVNITFRSKSQPAFTHTYPTVTFTNIVQYVQPNLVLWPRENYQGWAGTYTHTTTVEVQPAKGNFAGIYDGEAYNTAATYKFIFGSDGSWSWVVNNNLGLASMESYGAWMSPQPANGAAYSIRARNVVGNGTTIIGTAWTDLSADRIITVHATLPPNGEPDNWGFWKADIDIKNNATGEIILTGNLSLSVASYRQ